MTERFTVPVKYRFSHSKIQLNGEPLTNDELVRILNTNEGAFVENFALKEENERLKKENEELKNAIIGKIMYEEDLESFAITNGIIEHDWSRFDGYD